MPLRLLVLSCLLVGCNSGIRLSAVLSEADILHGVAFLDEGRTVFAGGVLWEAETLRRVQWSERPPGISGLRPFVVPCVTCDYAVSASGHHLWLADDRAGGQLALAPDARTVAAAAADNAVRLYETEGGKRVGELLYPTGTTVHCAAFAPDGRTIAIGSSRGPGIELRAVGVPGAVGQLVFPEPYSKNYVARIAFSADGRFVAGLGEVLCVWDWATRKPVWTVPTIDRGITVSLRFSGDGRYVAVGGFAAPPLPWGWGDAAWVTLWSSETGSPIARLTSEKWISSFDISPDGRRLVTSGHGVKLWTVEDRNDKAATR